MGLGLLNANLFMKLPSYHGSGAAADCKVWQCCKCGVWWGGGTANVVSLVPNLTTRPSCAARTKAGMDLSGNQRQNKGKLVLFSQETNFLYENLSDENQGGKYNNYQNISLNDIFIQTHLYSMLSKDIYHQ